MTTVELKEVNASVFLLNNANLRKLEIGELEEMLEDHTWAGEVVAVNPEFRLLVKYVLGKKNAYVTA